jgi:hypothetical protein
MNPHQPSADIAHRGFDECPRRAVLTCPSSTAIANGSPPRFHLIAPIRFDHPVGVGSATERPRSEAAQGRKPGRRRHALAATLPLSAG